MRYLWPAMLTTLCELMRLSDVCSTEGAEEDGLPPLVRAAASRDEPRCDAGCCCCCCFRWCGCCWKACNIMGKHQT